MHRVRSRAAARSCPTRAATTKTTTTGRNEDCAVQFMKFFKDSVKVSPKVADGDWKGGGGDGSSRPDAGTAVTVKVGFDSTTKPSGMTAVAAEAEPRDAARLSWMASATV